MNMPRSALPWVSIPIVPPSFRSWLLPRRVAPMPRRVSICWVWLNMAIATMNQPALLSASIVAAIPRAISLSRPLSISVSRFMRVLPSPAWTRVLRPTVAAINAYQNFLDNYPDSPRRDEAQQALFKLQDNLVQKEYLSAKLYYNLGGYFGNINSNTESNYESCIITAQNALKSYPYSDLREKFSILIMKSKFQLAENSSEEKRIERYRDAEDECYGFLNEFPDSKESATAQKYIVKCKKITGD